MTIEKLLADMKTEKPPVFTYLGEGVTTRAYLDPSEQFVLKILKTPEESIKRYREGTGVEIKTDYSISDKAKHSNELAAIEILDGVKKSLDLCLDKLREETALLFVHRQDSPSEIDKCLVMDKAGKPQTIEGLDKKCFFIQYKVDLLANAPNQEDEKASQAFYKKGLDDWLAFQSMLWGRGIPMANSDISRPQYNYGYFKGKLRCIDVGGLTEDPAKVLFQIKGAYVLQHKYATFMKNHGLHEYFTEKVREVYARGLRDYESKKERHLSEATTMGQVGFLKARSKDAPPVSERQVDTIKLI